MNLGTGSTEGLLSMYNAITAALREDDGLPSGRKRYGVREFPDWRTWSSALEAELRRRQVSFEPVPW